jgi:hypothetical protein
MSDQSGGFFGINVNDDEILREQFEAIDKLPEHEVRMCCKLAYAELRAAQASAKEIREASDRKVSEYRLKIASLEADVERRKNKVREMFDL